MRGRSVRLGQGGIRDCRNHMAIARGETATCLSGILIMCHCVFLVPQLAQTLSNFGRTGTDPTDLSPFDHHEPVQAGKVVCVKALCKPQRALLHIIYVFIGFELPKATSRPTDEY